MSSDAESPVAGGPDPAADGPASHASASTTSRARAGSPLGRAWRSFRAWRRSRPYWAGILLIIAGAELLLIPLPIHDMGVILHIGVGGVSGILIGAVLILTGLLLWLHPAQRVFYSVVAVLLAIAALVASNLGGFLLGTVLGIVGGSLGFAWMPGRPERRPRRRSQSQPTAPDDSITAAADTDAEAGTAAGPDREPESAAADDEAAADPADTQTQTPASAGLRPAPASARSTGHGHGSALHGVALIPLLGLLTALLSATGLLPQGSATSSSPGTCSGAATSAAPSPSPAASCSPAATPSAQPTPNPTPAPSPHVSGAPSASASPASGQAQGSPSPSPAPTGTPPPLAISTAQSTLTASSATLAGFAYDGVVDVPTTGGDVQMMQFSATSLDLTGVQLTVSQAGASQTTTAASLDLTGDVVLYATELSGDLLGIPITITPGTPIATILQWLGQAGFSQSLTQVVPLPMTNVTTRQPYTSADNMAASALDIS